MSTCDKTGVRNVVSFWRPEGPLHLACIIAPPSNAASSRREGHWLIASTTTLCANSGARGERGAAGARAGSRARQINPCGSKKVHRRSKVKSGANSRRVSSLAKSPVNPLPPSPNPSPTTPPPSPPTHTNPKPGEIPPPPPHRRPAPAARTENLRKTHPSPPPSPPPPPTLPPPLTSRPGASETLARRNPGTP